MICPLSVVFRPFYVVTPRLQIAGLIGGHDHVTLSGNPADNAFSVHYYRDGRLIACESINRPDDHLAARRSLDRRSLDIIDHRPAADKARSNLG